MPQFLSSIHFNGYQYPDSTGTNYIYTEIKKKERDWVDADVPGIGEQTVKLYCRAMPGRGIEDFVDFFGRGNCLFYKIFYTSINGRIFKILRVNAFALMESNILNYDQMFPMYTYSLKAEIRDVQETDDKIYKTYNEFSIYYGTGLQ